MRDTRELFETLIAEAIARFILGFGAAALMIIRRLPTVGWDDEKWLLLGPALAGGILVAVIGARKGPGAI